MMNERMTKVARPALRLGSLLGCLAVAAMACGPGKGTLLRARAVTDLGCTEEQITTNTLMPYVENVSGCGKQDIYAWDGGQDKWISLRDRAAFEVSCDKSALQVTVLDTATYGVSGCERRLVYKFLWMTGFVLDTASGPAGGPAKSAEPAAGSAAPAAGSAEPTAN